MSSVFDPIFNSYKIKFNVMNDILSNNEIHLGRKDPVNVYINLDSLYRELCRGNILQALSSDNNKEHAEHVSDFIANIMNLAAHYRRYFYRNNIYSRIILYSSFPCRDLPTRNSEILHGYRMNYSRSLNNTNAHFLRSIMNDAIPLAKIICEYIEDCHYITGNDLETSTIPYVYKNKIKDGESVDFIVTKDRYEYQYCNYGFMIFRPRKNDESYLITDKNLINILRYEENIKNGKTISSKMFPFIYSILGDKLRSVEKISKIGLSKILDIVSLGIESGDIKPEEDNIYLMSNIMKDPHKSTLLTNYSVTHIPTQIKHFSVRDFHTIQSQIINKFDNVSLKKITFEHFQNTPINMIDLTEPIELKEPFKVKKNIFCK